MKKNDIQNYLRKVYELETFLYTQRLLKKEVNKKIINLGNWQPKVLYSLKPNEHVGIEGSWYNIIFLFISILVMAWVGVQIFKIDYGEIFNNLIDGWPWIVRIIINIIYLCFGWVLVLIANIISANKLISIIAEEKNKMPAIFSFDGCKQMLINSFRGATEEKFVAFFLDKRGTILVRKIFSSHSANMVNFDLTDLLKGSLSKKPHSAVICHNHLSGNAKPSYCDDIATEKIMLTLKLSNVILYDHIIIAGENTFSYRSANRLDAIESKVNKIIY